MPRSAEASQPLMSYEMDVGEDSDDCSNVTVPETLESPRRTATVDGKGLVSYLHHHEFDLLEGVKEDR